MQKTGIEYLTHTWNPVAMRCTPCSPGCQSCWHLRTADRLCSNPAMPLKEREALAGEGPFMLRERELSAPLRMKKHAVIGVQFMGDLFHEDVPDKFRDDAYAVMHGCDRHTYLILTKRVNNLLKFMRNNFLPAYQGRDHIFLGVTICNQTEADEKIPDLLKVPGKKWLSIEPMLGEISLRKWFDICPKSERVDGNGHSWVFDGDDPYVVCAFCGERRDARSGRVIGCRFTVKSEIDAVVLGGETGPGARPMHPDWVRSVRDQCQAAGVAFYFKQWGEWVPCRKAEDGNYCMWPTFKTLWVRPDGSASPKHLYDDEWLIQRGGSNRAGRTLEGREWDELPWKE